MKNLIIVVASVVAMVGCARNTPVPQNAFEIANKTCATYNATPETITGQYWFPTFSANIKIVCRKEDSKEKLVITLEVE